MHHTRSSVDSRQSQRSIQDPRTILKEPESLNQRAKDSIGILWRLHFDFLSFLLLLCFLLEFPLDQLILLHLPRQNQPVELRNPSNKRLGNKSSRMKRTWRTSRQKVLQHGMDEFFVLLIVESNALSLQTLFFPRNLGL